MMKSPYKVYVIVDRQFGEKLALLPTGEPVWIVDTPINTMVVQRLWGQNQTKKHLVGITTFNDSTTASPEDLFLNQLDVVDLHHGQYSADPPYTILEGIGTTLTGKIKSALSDLGFIEFTFLPSGFSASRPLPESE